MLGKFLIILHIPFKFIWHQFSINLGDSSITTIVILLNSGNVLVDAIGFFIKLLIEKLRSADLPHLFHRSCLETLARKGKAKILSMDRRWPSKCWTTKIVIFWNCWMMKTIHSNWPYSKGRMWLKYFSHSDLLCTRATRTIVNHIPISEYQLRFFLHKDFKYPCSSYPIKTRCYILYEYKRYNNY